MGKKVASILYRSMIGLSVSGGKPFLNTSTYLFKHHFFGRKSVNRAVAVVSDFLWIAAAGALDQQSRQASHKSVVPRSQRGVVGPGYTADAEGDCVSDAALSCPDKILYDARILSLQ